MKPSLRHLALLGLSLWSATIARAELQPSMISADAHWVAYADLDGMRNTLVGKDLLEFNRKHQASAAGDTLAVDIAHVLESIGSITAYGSSASVARSLEGTLIAQGTPDLRKIAEALLLQQAAYTPPKVTVLTDLPFPAYAIVEMPQPARAQAQVIVAFPPEPMVLVSKSKAHLLKALAVLRQTAPSLAKVPDSTLSHLLRDSAHTYLFAASDLLSSKDLAMAGPQARVLQMATSGSIGMGETGPNTFAHATLSTGSEENAVKLLKIIQGLTAMLSFGNAPNAPVNQLVDSLAIVKEGDTVTLDISYPSAGISSMLKESTPAQPKAPSQGSQPQTGLPE